VIVLHCLQHKKFLAAETKGGYNSKTQDIDSQDKAALKLPSLEGYNRHKMRCFGMGDSNCDNLKFPNVLLGAQ